MDSLWIIGLAFRHSFEYSKAVATGLLKSSGESNVLVDRNPHLGRRIRPHRILGYSACYICDEIANGLAPVRRPGCDESAAN
jgi:hypothetical protein